MKDDRTYLTHISDAVEIIEAYLQGATYETFVANRMMVDAVVRQLEIIGEAASHLSADFRDKHADMLWRRMTDMRNFLIHEYFGVNTKIVWDTCQSDLPQLKSFIRTVLGS